VTLVPRSPTRLYKRITYGGPGNTTVYTIPIITAIVECNKGVYVVCLWAPLRVSCPCFTSLTASCFPPPPPRCRVVSISYDDGCFFCNSGTALCQPYGYNSTTNNTATLVSTKSCVVDPAVTNCNNPAEPWACDLKVGARAMGGLAVVGLPGPPSFRRVRTVVLPPPPPTPTHPHPSPPRTPHLPHPPALRRCLLCGRGQT
jgi:hypothetical protein